MPVYFFAVTLTLYSTGGTVYYPAFLPAWAAVVIGCLLTGISLAHLSTSYNARVAQRRTRETAR